MVHSFGYRARTRDMFSRPYKQGGALHLTPYLINYRIGDYVDVQANGAVHKGMPHKVYHGKTGIIWNITPRAVGVEVNKRVKGRILKKRIHVRVEHVKPSQCRKDFLERVEANQRVATHNKQSKPEDRKRLIKREPQGPKPSYTLKTKTLNIEAVNPAPYRFVC